MCHFGVHRVLVLLIIFSILVLDQIRKDRKQTAQELKIDEVEKSRVWSLYQSAQEKRKQIIKIEEEIVVCDREIERLNEKIKVGCLPKIGIPRYGEESKMVYTGVYTLIQ